MKKKKKSAFTQKKWQRILYLVCAALAVCFYIYSQEKADPVNCAPVDGLLTVYYIDVGQADCELIVCGDHSVLVDGGEAAGAADVLHFMEARGVSSLDCIVATHPHADHIGALPCILDNMRVGEVLMPELTEKNIPTTRTYEKFLEALADNGADAIRAVPGEQHQYGDIRFTILSPVFAETDGLNNMSVVFRLTYGNTAFLFTGDAEKAVEKELLARGDNLRADVLKVGHHGSNTSSTEDFINAVSPRYAVIECGDGTPSHPHKKTLERLAAVGAEVFRTDVDGTVTVTSDGAAIRIDKETDI